MKIHLIELLQSRKYRQMNELRILDHVYFKNGEYSVSIQASKFHYSHPREIVELDKYTHFELMLNIPYRDIPKYIYDGKDVRDIYAYVPYEDVEKLVNDLHSKYGLTK